MTSLEMIHGKLEKYLFLQDGEVSKRTQTFPEDRFQRKKQRAKHPGIKDFQAM